MGFFCLIQAIFPERNIMDYQKVKDIICSYPPIIQCTSVANVKETLRTCSEKDENLKKLIFDVGLETVAKEIFS